MCSEHHLHCYLPAGGRSANHRLMKSATGDRLDTLQQRHIITSVSRSMSQPILNIYITLFSKLVLRLLIAVSMTIGLTDCQQSGASSNESSSGHGVSVVQQGGSQSSSGTLTSSDWTDLEIAKAIYTDQRVPADFYRIDVPDDAFYTTYQLKNTDLVAVTDRVGMPVYELSTDDFSQALQWVETAAAYRPINKQLVDSTETDLYFQFSRVDLTNPQFIDLYRVFKSSALDRSGVDRSDPGSFQGTITLQSLTTQQVKTINEYLWTFSFANNFGTVVLQSNIEESDAEYIHSIVEARLDVAISGGCDTINIVEIYYYVDKANGDIRKDETFIRDFQAQRNQYGFEICNAG